MEGEFSLRRDPWAGLIASSGSFYPMVCRSWTLLSRVSPTMELPSTEKTGTGEESFGRLLGWWCTKGKGKVNRYLSIQRKRQRDRQLALYGIILMKESLKNKYLTFNRNYHWIDFKNSRNSVTRGNTLQRRQAHPHIGPRMSPRTQIRWSLPSHFLRSLG